MDTLIILNKDSSGGLVELVKQTENEEFIRARRSDDGLSTSCQVRFQQILSSVVSTTVPPYLTNLL